jgi:hypothetical protein
MRAQGRGGHHAVHRLEAAMDCAALPTPALGAIAQRRQQLFPTRAAAQMTRIAHFGHERALAADEIVFEVGDLFGSELPRP